MVNSEELEGCGDVSRSALFARVHFSTVIEKGTSRCVQIELIVSRLNAKKLTEQVSVCRQGRQWLVVSSQLGLHKEYRAVLQELQHNYPSSFLLLDTCPGEQKPWNYTRRCHGNTEYKYPEILQVSHMKVQLFVILWSLMFAPRQAPFVEQIQLN